MKSTRRGSFSVHRSEKNPRFQRQLDKRPLSPGIFTHIITSWGVLSQFPSGIIFLKPENSLAFHCNDEFPQFLYLYFIVSLFCDDIFIRYRIRNWQVWSVHTSCLLLGHLFGFHCFCGEVSPSVSVICCPFEDHVTFISGAFKILSFSWKQFHIF